nr:hypothetical protein [Octadecabacter ascidiaceicola]
MYHLAKFGWTDVALIERNALNADPNMNSL